MDIYVCTYYLRIINMDNMDNSRRLGHVLIIKSYKYADNLTHNSAWACRMCACLCTPLRLLITTNMK